MSVNVPIDNDKLALVIHTLSKRNGVSHGETVEHLLRLALHCERERIEAERYGPPGQSALDQLQRFTEKAKRDVPVTNPCSETILRQICGDDWELCWWLSSCALSQIGG